MRYQMRYQEFNEHFVRVGLTSEISEEEYNRLLFEKIWRLSKNSLPRDVFLGYFKLLQAKKAMDKQRRKNQGECEEVDAAVALVTNATCSSGETGPAKEKSSKTTVVVEEPSESSGIVEASSRPLSSRRSEMFGSVRFMSTTTRVVVRQQQHSKPPWIP